MHERGARSDDDALAFAVRTMPLQFTTITRQYDQIIAGKKCGSWRVACFDETRCLIANDGDAIRKRVDHGDALAVDYDLRRIGDGRRCTHDARCIRVEDLHASSCRNNPGVATADDDIGARRTCDKHENRRGEPTECQPHGSTPRGSTSRPSAPLTSVTPRTRNERWRGTLAANVPRKATGSPKRNGRP